MTKEELTAVLVEHEKWLTDKGGARANLARANLARANLTGANLTGANLARANLARADIPHIPNLDTLILSRLSQQNCKLDMGSWHRCETTHCRAGWAVVVAGEVGAKLEQAVGTNAAAAMIYTVSHPTEHVPNFYASNNAAMDDIKRRAAAEPTL